MIIAAVEGYPDAEVVRKILAGVGFLEPRILMKRGKGDLDKFLAGLKLSAVSSAPRCLVVRDLDNDAACPIELKNRLVPHPAPNLQFRIAVKEIESWLLGDREKFAAFLAIPLARLPQCPDSLPDPKQFVTQLASRSRNRGVREDLLPRPGSGASVGPGYAGRIGSFARDLWRPDAAAEQSPSLKRCIERLNDWRREA